MSCICENCKFLKETVENDTIVEYCEFGFPDESCTDCTGDRDCGLSCAHFEEWQDEEPQWVTVQCAVCGKELKQLDNGEIGRVYCPECYLNKQG